jgi:hypothetical protein
VNKPSNSHREAPKLSKLSISIISSIFGIGALCVAAGIGIAIPAIARWAACNALAIVHGLTAAAVVLVAYLLGRPVSHILSRGSK